MSHDFDSLFAQFDEDLAAAPEPVAEDSDGVRLANPLPFMLAGKAIFTLRSRRTGNRFTYKVSKKENENFWFVSVLTGADNNNDYTYLGNISVNGPQHQRYGSHSFWHSKKRQISPDAPSAKAFAWAFRKLVVRAATPDLEIHHCGFCGRCGRLLTVPESVASGYGPECIGKVGGL